LVDNGDYKGELIRQIHRIENGKNQRCSGSYFSVLMNWKKVKKIVEFIVALLSFLLEKGKKENEPPDDGKT